MKAPTNTTQTPRGGWKFTDPVTGIPVQHTHFLAFMQKVREIRLANGHELTGGWEDEVLDELCRQNPHIECMEVGVPEIRMNADDVHRFLTVLGEMGSFELVSEEEHIRRADICLKCPMLANVNCKWCGWAAKKITELLGGRKLHRVAELHKKGCLACKCNVDTKTYYPVDVLRAVDQKVGKQPEYAEGCWMLDASVDSPHPTP